MKDKKLDYMELLAKVMRNKCEKEDGVDTKDYDQFYSLIHTKFYEQLRKVRYPDISDVLQKCENFLEAMEQFYLCPELVGKKCLLISNTVTTKVFATCRPLFGEQDIVAFSEKLVDTQIPFVIVHAEEGSKIQVLNYANVRVSLSEDEFVYLLRESAVRELALNKVVQYVIIHTALSEPDLCIISDNRYAQAEKLFSRAVSLRIAAIDSTDLKTLDKRPLKGFNVLVMSAETIAKTRYNPLVKSYRIKNYGQIPDLVKDEVKQVLYGFSDEFLSIKTQIMSYYEEQQKETREVSRAVIDDIVRLEETGDTLLTDIKKDCKEREKLLEEEGSAISAVLDEVESRVKEICKQWEDERTSGKTISRATWDDIFESFFRCNDFTQAPGAQLLTRLSTSAEYGDSKLVESYYKKIMGFEERKGIQASEIDKSEWEKAKMLLYILEPEDIPKNLLKSYVESLGKRCSTGKELYAKALISPEREKIGWLQRSLEKGYERAGNKLLEIYKQEKKKKGKSSVDLLSLANGMLPEACMQMAEEEIRRGKGIAGLTYYKIAAAQEYLPAIGKIIDIFFKTRGFSSGELMPDSDQNKEKIEVGLEICKLCRFLIDKGYRTNYYKNVLGKVLFSLHKDWSEAKRLLENCDDALAYYCKGYMYEFGDEVDRDFAKAIENYEKAIEKEELNRENGEAFVQRVSNRLENCKEKNNRALEIKTQTHEENTPTIKVTKTDDDGCFLPGTKILMADGSTRTVETVKVNDAVIVYDHYLGTVKSERIIANIHDVATQREFEVISMFFEKKRSLPIVKSHVIFDCTDAKYVWIDAGTVGAYIGHEFAFYDDGKIVGCKLLDYTIESITTNYYVPISKFHLNVFAENFLTMPPTKLTVNLFPISDGMRYDLAALNKVGKTSYEEIKDVVTEEEYADLPCEYFGAIMANNQCTYEDFKYAIKLYRDQSKYKGAGGEKEGQKVR